jgi:hypothetical protein
MLSVSCVIVSQNCCLRVRRENSKAIPVTGRGGPEVCEMSRLPHCLDNRLIDGGEFVSYKGKDALYTQEDCW